MAKFVGAGVECWLEDADGSQSGATSPVAAQSLSAANPAVLTIAAASIGQFKNGDTVTVAGAPTAAQAANGAHAIANVDETLGTMELVGVDLSAAVGGPWTTGITVKPAGTAAGPEKVVTIVSISNTKPAVLTVAAADLTGLTNGDVVKITGTDSDLDNGGYVVSGIDAGAGTAILNGTDLSGFPAAIAKGTAAYVPWTHFLKYCLTEWTHSREAADSIDTSTFCGSEAIAGVSPPGEINITAFYDPDTGAMYEWMEGVKDGTPRVMRVRLPDQAGGGEVIFVVTPSGYERGITLDEAASFTGTAVVNREPIELTGPYKVAA